MLPLRQTENWRRKRVCKNVRYILCMEPISFEASFTCRPTLGRVQSCISLDHITPRFPWIPGCWIWSDHAPHFTHPAHPPAPLSSLPPLTRSAPLAPGVSRRRKIATGGGGGGGGIDNDDDDDDDDLKSTGSIEFKDATLVDTAKQNTKRSRNLAVGTLLSQLGHGAKLDIHFSTTLGTEFHFT